MFPSILSVAAAAAVLAMSSVASSAFAAGDNERQRPAKADESWRDGRPGKRGPHGPKRSLIDVKIIGLNDYHGNLQSPGTFGQNTAVPFAKRPAVGGADAIAAYVQRLKRENRRNNVVVGAGDFIGASPLISALFFDEPSVETLNRIGLEFNAVGNHEFDKGSGELLRLQRGGCKENDGVRDPNSCQGAQVGTPVPFEGAQFQWLSANVVRSSTGRTLLPPYGVKTFDGVPVAFVGMTLKGTPSIVTPSGVAGLEFRDEAATVNALLPHLRRRGIEAIVVLLHQGGFQSPGLSDINGCDGDLVGTELAQIVAQLDDAVDLVISGHTHSAYNCSANTVDVTASGEAVTQEPRRAGLPNLTGRPVPVTSAGAFGRVLSDIDVKLDPRSRDIVKVSPTNRLVDRTDPQIVADIQAHPTVRDLVAAYQGLVAPIANRVVGATTAELPNRADDAGNMPAGELIADAQLQATAGSGTGNAVIAFMNPGGVRSPGFTFASSPAGEGDGRITYGEAFTTQPFGNSLVTVTITAQNLKNALEQQFAGCRGQAGTRMLIPSAGLKYTWREGQGCDARIVDLRRVNANGAVIDQIVDATGRVLEPARTYRVTINNFLATGGDGFTTFVDGTSDALGGGQDIDALTAYLASFRPPERTAYDPAAPERLKPRIVRAP